MLVINKIAADISSEIIKQAVGTEINKSKLSAVVQDISKKENRELFMTIDATFWVAISFFIFFGVLIYLKVPPQKINITINKPN